MAATPSTTRFVALAVTLALVCMSLAAPRLRPFSRRVGSRGISRTLRSSGRTVAARAAEAPGGLSVASESKRRGGVALVTGATRGIGKGIAVGLGELGMKVYITGRTVAPSDNAPRADGVGGSLMETKELVEAAGGSCEYVRVDSSDDSALQGLIQRIEKGEGKLDILVNNAYGAVDTLGETMGTPFWEKPPTIWDDINNVGLRSHYVTTCLAAPLLLKSAEKEKTTVTPTESSAPPLVVHVSSLGGLTYVFDVAYGIGKDAVDRMAADMAVELTPKGVAVCSLWPGLVKTEKMTSLIKSTNGRIGSLDDGESPIFVGRAVAALACADDLLTKRSGTVQPVEDLATQFQFTDEDGKVPPSFRSVKGLAASAPQFIKDILPRGLKLPWWMLKAFVKPMPRFSQPVVNPNAGPTASKSSDSEATA